MIRDVDLEKIRTTAEEYYRSGDFYCSEAVVKTIKDAFSLPVSDEVISMASGLSSSIKAWHEAEISLENVD
jgi:hypothetical protein